MRILHPEYTTAGSDRTCGMPLRFYTEKGVLTREAASTKKRCYFEVPDSTAYAVLLYSSNSGRRTVFVYDVRKGKLSERLPRGRWPAWIKEVEDEYCTPVQ